MRLNPKHTNLRCEFVNEGSVFHRTTFILCSIPTESMRLGRELILLRAQAFVELEFLRFDRKHLSVWIAQSERNPPIFKLRESATQFIAPNLSQDCFLRNTP